jgi:hypothetical protein
MTQIERRGFFDGHSFERKTRFQLPIGTNVHRMGPAQNYIFIFLYRTKSSLASAKMGIMFSFTKLYLNKNIFKLMMMLVSFMKHSTYF